MLSLRRWFYHALEQRRGSRWHWLSHVLAWLVLANVIVVIVESDKHLHHAYEVWFDSFEAFSVGIFTLEYGLRLWVCVESPNPAWQHPLWGRLRYARSWLAVIDLLAILPFFIGLFWTEGDWRILRSLRLMRLLKLTRYSHSLELLLAVLRQEFEHLLSAVFILCLFILVCATGIYLVEGRVQPEVFGSIPRALWWAVVTVATVGYGDSVPITILGKLFSGLIIVSGITIAALPAAILASGMINELARRRERFRTELLKLLQDGKLDFAELRHLEKLRLHIGISRADAKLVFEETKQAQRWLEKPVQCPHCGQVFSTERVRVD